jgi:hypothetical protein
MTFNAIKIGVAGVVGILQEMLMSSLISTTLESRINFING